MPFRNNSFLFNFMLLSVVTGCKKEEPDKFLSKEKALQANCNAFFNLISLYHELLAKGWEESFCFRIAISSLTFLSVTFA